MILPCIFAKKYKFYLPNTTVTLKLSQVTKTSMTISCSVDGYHNTDKYLTCIDSEKMSALNFLPRPDEQTHVITGPA